VSKTRIAHLAGPTATIQNTPPLVTSNKARQRKGLPLFSGGVGDAPGFDALRPQRLAAPVKVYVEQFSAHPLEADAAELYGPPDGYINADGAFSAERTNENDKPVYEIELSPEDRLYPLPYMAVQADGAPWEEETAAPFSTLTRQGFFPDGSRSFEEIDRLSIGVDGKVNLIGGRAEVDFYRVAPPGGFTKGLPAGKRADKGEGDTPPERLGWDFFAYKPFHLAKSPPRPVLAKITNDVQRIMSSGQYDGAIWTQGSPQVEESAYWFNLLIDTHLPIACNAAQRPQGQISNDGPANIADSVTYIRSRIWANAEGRNRCGTVVIQEQQFFAAREVAKVDARPGGYVAGSLAKSPTAACRTSCTCPPIGTRPIRSSTLSGCLAPYERRNSAPQASPSSKSRSRIRMAGFFLPQFLPCRSSRTAAIRPTPSETIPQTRPISGS
jgi:L-asparaginase